jgi:hypothetical protein
MVLKKIGISEHCKKGKPLIPNIQKELAHVRVHGTLAMNLRRGHDPLHCRDCTTNTPIQGLFEKVDRVPFPAILFNIL